MIGFCNLNVVNISCEKSAISLSFLLGLKKKKQKQAGLTPWSVGGMFFSKSAKLLKSEGLMRAHFHVNTTISGFFCLYFFTVDFHGWLHEVMQTALVPSLLGYEK